MNNQGLFKSSPLHVGIIMDGNRRWAKSKNLAISFGHKQGAETFKKIAKYANKIGIQTLTVYAFSTENWNRSSAEVAALMMIFKRYLKTVAEEFKNEDICVKFIGDMSVFSSDIRVLVNDIEEQTKNRLGMKLNIAMNYGSRKEITYAVKKISEKILLGDISVEDISEKIVSKYLYTHDLPDVDLVIRTGGEERLSNFMLWQSAYAEFYFTNILWPDFSEKDFDAAIETYFSRIRRFGGA